LGLAQSRARCRVRVQGAKQELEDVLDRIKGKKVGVSRPCVRVHASLRVCSALGFFACSRLSDFPVCELSIRERMHAPPPARTQSEGVHG
jgi:hypothetical protein